MRRRRFLTLLSAASVAAALPVRAQRAPTLTRPLEELRKGWRSFAPAGLALPEATPPLTRSEDEWRKALAPERFRILREEGTERPFTSPLDTEKRRGLFVCAGCGLPLFTSEMKYDSATGWPSFFTTIPGAAGTKTDFKHLYPRTEYHCRRCEGHQGHVFTDGPPPTGERWCNNGLALVFHPA